MRTALGSLVAGTLIAGRYEIVGPLAKGGMGLLFKARQVALDRIVAVKVLPIDDDPKAYQRFELEAKAAAGLSHPNIVSIYDYGRMDDGRPFIVMEYIEGVPLFKVLRTHGHLEEKHAAELFMQVCDGLYCAHRQGVVHRDLKPGNILLVPAPTGDMVKIIDFGLAKRFYENQNLTESGVLVGTPLYMSPEQCRGEPTDARSDVYSLGCVIYHMVAGTAPFEGDSPVSTMYKHLLEGLVFSNSLAETSAAMKRVITKCLEKNAVDRYQTALELKIALKRVLDVIPEKAPDKILQQKASGTTVRRATGGESSPGSTGVASVSSKNSGTNERAQEVSDVVSPAVQSGGDHNGAGGTASVNGPAAGTATKGGTVERSNFDKTDSKSADSGGGSGGSRTEAKKGADKSHSTAGGDDSSGRTVAMTDRANPQGQNLRGGAEQTLRGSFSDVSMLTSGAAVRKSLDTGSGAGSEKQKAAALVASAGKMVPWLTAGALLAAGVVAGWFTMNNREFQLAYLPTLQSIDRQQGFYLSVKLADEYVGEHDTRNAFTMYERARWLAADHLEFGGVRIAHVHAMLAQLYQLRPQLVQAAKEASIAKHLFEEYKGTTSPDYAPDVANLAAIRLKQGNIEAALENCNMALKAFEIQQTSNQYLPSREDCLQLKARLAQRIEQERQERLDEQPGAQNNAAPKPNTSKRSGIRSAGPVATSHRSGAIQYANAGTTPQSVLEQVNATGLANEKVARVIKKNKRGLLKSLKRLVGDIVD